MSAWVRVEAPVRVLDAGGWTDTWFAGGGLVCQLAVQRGCQVLVRLLGRSPTGESGTVDLDLDAFGVRYQFALNRPPGRFPLLEAALRSGAGPDWRMEVGVRSWVPPGSSLGTSASVVVATLAALRALAGTPVQPNDLARAAHDVEAIDIGLESGVQDQVAAAYGGCNLVAIGSYPRAEVAGLELSSATWEALGRRILTVYLGSSHQSSAVHKMVIARLRGIEGYDLLAPLRIAAREAAAALVAGDLDGYGRAMARNTVAQSDLHPALVNPAAHGVIELAQKHGAAGWKVNGAGGDGGTVTIVGPEDPSSLLAALDDLSGPAVLPLVPARAGVRVLDQS